MTRTHRRLAAASLSVVLVLGAAACADRATPGSDGDRQGHHHGIGRHRRHHRQPTMAARTPPLAAGTGTVTLADGAAAADKTVSFTDDGGFDPPELTVKVGELFTFKAGDDGTHAVKFGDSSDTYTISGGLIESFTIDAAGTYTVTEDLSSKTMTVTVTA